MPTTSVVKNLRTVVRRILQHPALPILLAALAVLLCSPSLRVGLVLDDVFHKAALTAPDQLSEMARGPTELFAWVGEGWPAPGETTPWWSSEELRVAFFRPLSSLTHWLDYQGWPQSPFLMHLHSLLWFGLVVFASAKLFRCLAVPGEVWIAGLAGLFFALDDSHSWPAIWIANRNALLALFFGVLALLAHHRWRREGWRPGAWLAPTALACALLSGEGAVAGGAYLLSYALFLDRGPLGKRLIALGPCAAVGVVWQLSYRALGYGAFESGFYIDPGSQPLRFLEAATERLPILLWGQLSYPPSDLYLYLSQDAARSAWLLVVVLLALFGLLLIPLLRRDVHARFWTFGMLLALLPSCSTYPTQRLLLYASLGGASLLAIFVARAWQSDSLQAEGVADPKVVWRWTARVLTVPLLLIHLVQAPMSLWGTARGVSGVAALFTNTAATFPNDPALLEQTALVVNGPCTMLTSHALVHHALDGQPIPKGTLNLATSLYPVEVHRPDARSLTVRPRGGFLAPPGSAPPGQTPRRQSFSYLFQVFDTVLYGGHPFQVGQTIEHRGMKIEIHSITDDGRPAAANFHFPRDLEDPSWRWLQWESGGFAEWQPPPVGTSVTLQ